jgi:hypothetical protein
MDDVRARWLPLLLVSLTGCTLLYWPSSGELVGEGDAGLPDAADASVGPSADATTPDSGEAGTSALQCPPNAILCDDFERDTGMGPFQKAQGAVASSRARAHSPTRSLSATVTQGRDAPIVESILTMPPKVTVSFWFYAASPPSRGDRDLRIAQVLWGNDCDWDLSLTVFLRTGEGLRYEAAVYDVAQNASCGPVVNSVRLLLSPGDTFVPKWHHITFTMDVSSKTRRTNATADEILLPSNDVISKRTTVPGSARVTVGVPCVNDGAGCFGWDGSDYEVLIDDVTVVPTD